MLQANRICLSQVVLVVADNVLILIIAVCAFEPDNSFFVNASTPADSTLFRCCSNKINACAGLIASLVCLNRSPMQR